MKKTFIAVGLLASAFQSAWAAEDFTMGTRLWISSGETEWSHCASVSCGGGYGRIGGEIISLGDPTSKLNYSNLDANVFEIFAIKKFVNNYKLQTTFGTGDGDTGKFRDQDWLYVPRLNRTYEFSDTESRVKNIDLSHFIIDFGRTIENEKSNITPFIGYVNYQEKLSANGLSCLPTDLSFVCSAIPDSINVISNDITWTGLRFGGEMEFNVSDNANIIINAAYVATVEGKNKDSHVLRNDLGPTPNILSDGEGDGLMIDLIGKYTYSKTLSFEAGYRYWKFEADKGTTKFGPNFSRAYPTRSLYSERSGLLVGAKYKF